MDLQKCKKSGRLKSDYLVRVGITARQFNAVKTQLEGKISAIRELLPVQIENLKTKIRKAKKNIASWKSDYPFRSNFI